MTGGVLAGPDPRKFWAPGAVGSRESRARSWPRKDRRGGAKPTATRTVVAEPGDRRRRPLIIPGFGQLYANAVVLGVIFVVAWTIPADLVQLPHPRPDQPRPGRTTGRCARRASHRGMFHWTRTRRSPLRRADPVGSVLPDLPATGLGRRDGPPGSRPGSSAGRTGSSCGEEVILVSNTDTPTHTHGRLSPSGAASGSGEWGWIGLVRLS